MNIPIPGYTSLDLPYFYTHLEDYYKTCEMRTKEWVAKNVSPEWVIIDAGANIGYYTILFSKLASRGEIHAFEPTATMEMLWANVRYNGCYNVYLYQTALGARLGHRVEPIYRMWGNEPEIAEYDFATIDHLVEILDPERLDLIKIDVDSFDYEVLLGAKETLTNYNPWIIVELNHALTLRGYSKDDALKWLYEQGYRSHIILDDENYVMRRA